MRRSHVIATAAVAAVTIAVGPAAAAAVNGKKANRLHCTIESVALGQPNPSAVSLGFVSCPKPFGEGLHYNRVTITTPPSPGVAGAATGVFKNYYNRGTARGSVVLTIVASSPKNITYSGTVTYTGGTGRFTRVKGTGAISCTTTDGGLHKSCAVDSKLTGV